MEIEKTSIFLPLPKESFLSLGYYTHSYIIHFYRIQSYNTCLWQPLEVGCVESSLSHRAGTLGRI